MGLKGAWTRWRCRRSSMRPSSRPCKEPFAGPEQVLRYLSRYTHRIAISNRRLIAFDENGVTFKYKDYGARAAARATSE